MKSRNDTADRKSSTGSAHRDASIEARQSSARPGIRPARRPREGTERCRHVDCGQWRQTHLLWPRSDHSQPPPLWHHGGDRSRCQSRCARCAVAAPDRRGAGHRGRCPQGVAALLRLLRLEMGNHQWTSPHGRRSPLNPFLGFDRCFTKHGMGGMSWPSTSTQSWPHVRSASSDAAPATSPCANAILQWRAADFGERGGRGRASHGHGENLRGIPQRAPIHRSALFTMPLITVEKIGESEPNAFQEGC